MSTPPETCRDESRRARVRARQVPGQPPVLNGIDYIEVGGDQVTLTVHLLHDVPKGLTEANIRVDGGRRITGIKVLPFKAPARPHGTKPSSQFTIKVDRAGDFSPYTLGIVEADAAGKPGTTPLAGFDPYFASVDFSFKVDCPTGLDCAPAGACPPAPADDPAIDYLTKDYSSFRQLIFDRLSLITPGWAEQHVPDLGVALVELLAYTGDSLSYLQDAVATEAYLGTARQRISVRRHVRLVDYFMHEGCNARAWVCLKASASLGTGPVKVDLSGARFVAGIDAPGSTTRVVFEALSPRSILLDPAHNEIHFYTWGDRECCLPRGTTSATLWAGPAAKSALALKPGDVLIFEEVKGPNTGAPADADATHRCAVRLTSVSAVTDPLTNDPVCEVEWAADDALPFPLCVSSLGAPPLCAEMNDVSVARGNVVLVDQGETTDEELVPVPASSAPVSKCVATGQARDVPQAALPYRPPLGRYPVTRAVPFPTPGDVARRQARILDGLMARVRAVLPGLLQQVKTTGTPLDTPGLAPAGTIFGNKQLREVGLLEWETPEAAPIPAEAQVRAMNRLLAREGRVLAGKARRVHVLTEYARSGYVLTADQVAEVGEMFGAPFAGGLAPDDPQWLGPARSAPAQDPRSALPSIALSATRPDAGTKAPKSQTWGPAFDLLSSQAADRVFVAEVDDNGQSWLRFGDGDLGAAPAPSTAFAAKYRVGNGVPGNVPAGSITRVTGLPDPTVLDTGTPVRNPLPASGGVDPEPIDEVKLFAPGAFRAEKKRAVTADDYAALAGLVPGVQRAAATIRSTGAIREARVAIDPLGTEGPDPALIDDVRAALEPYRRIGHDLRVVQASYVAVDLALSVGVLPDYLRGHVEAALLRVFSAAVNPDGPRGMFHPDNLSFGQNIELSRIVAAAQGVAGVRNVTVTRLRRFGDPPPPPRQADPAVTAGVLAFDPLEVPRLDNDPSFPEHGTFTLTLRGGR